MIPFDAETFSRLFAQYNAAIWPAQLGALMLGLTVLWLAIKPRPWSGRFIAASLAAFWLWCGIVFHMQYHATINWAAWGFGAFFVLQGLLILWSGVLRGRLDIRFAGRNREWSGLGMAAAAIVLFPSLAWTFGRDWNEIDMFGVGPGPTALFTLGLMLLGQPRPPFGLMIVPALWSLAAGAMALTLARPEDLILAAAACLALGLAVAARFRDRRS